MFFRRKKKASEEQQERDEGRAPPAAGGVDGPPADGPRSTTTQFLTGEAGKDRRNVQVLLETIARVSEARDIESLLLDIVDRSIEITGAERGLLLMRSAHESSTLAVRVARLRGSKPLSDDVRFSTSIASKVLKEVQAVRATVHSESEALELGRSVYDLKLRAVMCVPLAAGEAVPGDGSKEPAGVLYVDSRAATRQFSQGDLALFAALAQHIYIALENARLHLDSIEKLRLEQSLELASAIQRDLMPQVPKDLRGWEVHGWYGPAEETAGDFYDFVKVRDGRLALAVGDVTGHGIGPALITAAAQASMRSYLRFIGDPGDVVTLLNQDLCERVEDGRFLTLFLAFLAENGEVVALNAGHAPPFLWRSKGGAVETIESNGPALGMLADEKYRAHPPVRLESGDVLVVYTDGLTEARDPADHDRMLGDEGVKAALCARASTGADARAIAQHLVETAAALSGEHREDDLTVVVARRL